MRHPNPEELASSVWLRNPETGHRFVPLKMLKRGTGERGFRVLKSGSNAAADDRVVQSEQEVVRAFRDGCRVRCINVDDPSAEQGAYAIGGKLGLELEQGRT